MCGRGEEKVECGAISDSEFRGVQGLEAIPAVHMSEEFNAEEALACIEEFLFEKLGVDKGGDEYSGGGCGPAVFG